jgi:hypothetical protein
MMTITVDAFIGLTVCCVRNVRTDLGWVAILLIELSDLIWTSELP